MPGAIIIGARPGIGLAVARRFAREGGPIGVIDGPLTGRSLGCTTGLLYKSEIVRTVVRRVVRAGSQG